MNEPLTRWEKDGSWSSRVDEELFFTQLASETAVNMSEAGRSVLGNPLWRIELGEGESTFMIVGGVHGGEPSGRETVMMWLRDLAYSNDPAIVSYLQTHRIVVVPTANPDGAPPNMQRNNANGVNLNRDYFRLTQPETRAIKRVMNDTNPVLLVDLHQVGTNLGYDWRPYAGGIPGGYAPLQQVTDECLDACKADLLSHGFTSLDYAIGSLPWSGLSTIAPAYHMVGILSEPASALPIATRVDLTLILFESMRQWHTDKRGEMEAAKAASIAAAQVSTDPIPIPTRQYLGTGAVTTVDVADGYEVDGYLPPELLELHGIEAEGQFVSVSQPARLIIAALFDPASYEYVIGNEWWQADPSETAAPAALGVSVREDGVIFPVQEIWVQQSGARSRVLEVWSRSGGVRQRVG